ncbi:MAG: 6-phosphofructokinase [Phycisphaerales bacterium]
MLFLSYRQRDEAIVEAVSGYLNNIHSLPTYFHPHRRTVDSTWMEQISEALSTCDATVSFLGDEIGEIQREEMKHAGVTHAPALCVVRLSEGARVAQVASWSGAAPINAFGLDESSARKCAEDIAKIMYRSRLGAVPFGYPFSYEKEIVDEFVDPTKTQSGRPIPDRWPREMCVPAGQAYANPVPPAMIGELQETGIAASRVNVVARADTKLQPYSLLEARPRRWLVYPAAPYAPMLRVGILVSGGIAPGINAVISGIWHRHRLYSECSRDPKYGQERPHKIEVYGYYEGFKALLERTHGHAPSKPFKELHERNGEFVDEHAHLGGSMIGTSRCDRLISSSKRDKLEALDAILATLHHDKVDILYVIGGDGSMRAAHELYCRASSAGQVRRPLSIVGIPKTMDNDILWVWQAFGFMSAVERARETIQHIQTEVQSNPRLAVVQLFGSDSGFVTAHAVLGAGGCDCALVPEVSYSMTELSAHIGDRLLERRRENSKAHGMIVMAEAAIPEDADRYLNGDVAKLSEPERRAVELYLDQKRRVRGQIPDELRTAGLKIVSRVLEDHIRRLDPNDPYWRSFRVLTNEPRHIIRAVAPSVSDVVFGQRLGALAVDNAMAGYTNFMISQWLTEYVVVPLELVVLGRKRLPAEGIFWKSVLASTGQPNLASPV